MTLFYDYNMLFIYRIYDIETFAIFFSKSLKQALKDIISKESDFIWSSCNIHFVSLHHKYHHHHHHHHHFPLLYCNNELKALTSPPPSPWATHRNLIIIQAKGGGGIEPCLTGFGKVETEVSRLSSRIKVLLPLNMEVFRVNSALSPTNRCEE